MGRRVPLGKKYIICFSLVKEENNFLEKFTEVSVRVPCRILACFGRYPEAGGGGGGVGGYSLSPAPPPGDVSGCHCLASCLSV